MCQVHKRCPTLEAKAYLEDHPSGCKWLITMAIVVVPQIGLVIPLPKWPFLHGL